MYILCSTLSFDRKIKKGVYNMNSYPNAIQHFYNIANTTKPTKMQVIHAYMNYLNTLTTAEVSFLEMARIVKNEQRKFEPDLTLKEAAESINAVMHKRNVQFAFLIAIDNDLRVQFHQSFEPLQSILFEDRGTFGGDEQIALEIANLYGTIGITNFGYLDREKQGFIKEIDQIGKNRPDITTTFIDDILSAVIAAAEARVAHIRDQGHDDEPVIDAIDLNSLKF